MTRESEILERKLGHLATSNCSLRQLFHDIVPCLCQVDEHTHSKYACEWEQHVQAFNALMEWSEGAASNIATTITYYLGLHSEQPESEIDMATELRALQMVMLRNAPSVCQTDMVNDLVGAVERFAGAFEAHMDIKLQAAAGDAANAARDLDNLDKQKIDMMANRVPGEHSGVIRCLLRLTTTFHYKDCMNKSISAKRYANFWTDDDLMNGKLSVASESNVSGKAEHQRTFKDMSISSKKFRATLQKAHVKAHASFQRMIKYKQEISRSLQDIIVLLKSLPADFAGFTNSWSTLFYEVEEYLAAYRDFEDDPGVPSRMGLATFSQRAQSTRTAFSISANLLVGYAKGQL